MAPSDRYRNTEPGPWDSPGLVLLILSGGFIWISWVIAHDRLHLTHRQIAEVVLYLSCVFASVAAAVVMHVTAKTQREKQWPHLPMVPMSVPKHVQFRELKKHSPIPESQKRCCQNLGRW